MVGPIQGQFSGCQQCGGNCSFRPFQDWFHPRSRRGIRTSKPGRVLLNVDPFFLVSVTGQRDDREDALDSTFVRHESGFRE